MKTNRLHKILSLTEKGTGTGRSSKNVSGTGDNDYGWSLYQGLGHTGKSGLLGSWTNNGFGHIVVFSRGF